MVIAKTYINWFRSKYDLKCLSKSLTRSTEKDGVKAMVVVITRRRVNCQLVKWHASVHRSIALQLITVKASLA